MISNELSRISSECENDRCENCNARQIPLNESYNMRTDIENHVEDKACSVGNRNNQVALKFE